MKGDDNRFKDAEDIPSLIYQIVGAASVCWENPGGAGIFDEGTARAVAIDALERLSELAPEIGPSRLR